MPFSPLKLLKSYPRIASGKKWFSRDEGQASIPGELDPLVQAFLEKVKSSRVKLNVKQIRKALEFGINAHDGQERTAGGPYFIHPIRVAIRALGYEVDTKTIIGILLHDTIEDTSVTVEDIQREFGSTVASLVQALTKVRGDKALTLSKILKLGYEDFRVVLIKLFDRWDNMTDLKALFRHKQRRICAETIAVYSEVAHGLGLIEIEEQFKELTFKLLYPKSYKRVCDKIDNLMEERSLAIDEIVQEISQVIKPYRMLSITPQFIRPHKFLTNRSEIYHILESIMIETKKPAHCYKILGELHLNFRSVPLTFRDYISNPKANGWRGLTTELIVNGEKIPIYIVTEDFHEKNRKGILTLMKENVYNDNEYQKFIENYLTIVAQGEIRIEDVLKLNSVPEIQVLTPKGTLIELRHGATILDFAFEVHSEVGLRCAGATIDHVRYPPQKILEDGMVVHVITDNAVEPTEDWENIVVMPKAKRAIHKYLQKK